MVAGSHRELCDKVLDGSRSFGSRHYRLPVPCLLRLRAFTFELTAEAQRTQSNRGERV